MKKILSTILILSTLITGLSITSLAQEGTLIDATSTFFISDFLRRFNTTFTNKTADYLDSLSSSSQNGFSFFEKYGKKSLICTLLFASFSCFSEFTSRARDFLYTIYMYDYFKDKFRDGVHFLDWLHPIKNVSIEETIFRLNEGLSELKGQENAKKEGINLNETEVNNNTIKINFAEPKKIANIKSNNSVNLNSVNNEEDIDFDNDNDEENNSNNNVGESTLNKKEEEYEEELGDDEVE